MAISLIDVNPEVQTLFHQISFNQQVVDLVNAVIGNDYITLKEISAPSHTSGYGKIYVKSSDSKLYFKDDSGAEYDLTAGGGGGANTTLSNLTSPTAINQDLLASGTRVLGDSTTGRWTGLYSTFGNFSTTVDITGNLTVDTNVLFVNTSTNRVGINNSSPAYDLDVTGNGFFSNALYISRISANPTLAILTYSNSVFDGSNILNYRARGTSTSSFSAIQSGDILGALQYLGANAANTWGNVSCQIQVVATENHSSTAAGTRINFETVANTTTTRNVRLIIDQNGAVTVGSSSGTGTGAFYAGATTITTLTGSGNVNIDSGLFYVDVANDRIGVKTTSPSHLIHIVGGSLATTKKALYISATLSNPGGATNEEGVFFDISTTGANNSLPTGLQVYLNAGFTGARTTHGFYCVNSVAGTTGDIVGLQGNFGYRGQSTATTTGYNYGTSGYAQGGNVNIGDYSVATVAKSGAVNIGVMGNALNSLGTPIGGYFGLHSSNPSFTSGALVCDNGAVSAPIFVARENGTVVFSILDGGNVNVDSGTFYVDIVNNRVGVNNPSPAYPLDITGNTNIVGQIAIRSTSGNPTVTNLSYSNTALDGANYMMQRARGGSISSFTAVQSGDILGALQTIGANGANTWGNTSGQIQFIATENHTGTAAGTYLQIQLVASTTTSLTTRFILNHNGSLTLGSSVGSGSGDIYIGSGYFNNNISLLADKVMVSSVSNDSFITPDLSGNAVMASRGSAIIHIDYDNSGTTSLFKFRVDNTTDIWYIQENGGVVHTSTATGGRAYDLIADSITTDGIMRLYSNSSDATARYLFNIVNDHTSATGAIPIRIAQDALISTNFKQYFLLDDVTVWKSNGTDPNGVLSGSVGDFCLYTNGTGGTKTCAGGTTWN